MRVRRSLVASGRQRGAAVILALLVMTLGVLLVSGAFLRQSVMVRQVENDAASGQARWLLTGAIDWVRAVLREDGRSTLVDHAGSRGRCLSNSRASRAAAVSPLGCQGAWRTRRPASTCAT